MLKASPLLVALDLVGTTNPTRDLAVRLAERFDFVPDTRRFGDGDNWPTRAEVVADLAANAGRLQGDCDDHAFAAAYALHDLGVGARVVAGICETGAGHMVCEDEHGSVIDNRFPGRVLTWTELERIGYRSSEMNGLNFEEQPRAWFTVKVGPDGCRDYSGSAT